MKTLPLPSTASPVKHAPSATSAKWSGAWPGVASGLEGTEAGAVLQQHVRRLRDRPPAARGSCSRSAAHRLAVVAVVVGEHHAAEPTALLHRFQDPLHVRRPAAGPGSMTQAGPRPTTHVFVPVSVSGPGLGARTRSTS